MSKQLEQHGGHLWINLSSRFCQYGVRPVPSDSLEADIREYLVELMPLEHAPAHLRLAFHDAGTYDERTGTGGAHGTVHLPEELQRLDNAGWGQACLELLAEVKER